jgi:AcrR family transcriptional regulator
MMILNDYSIDLKVRASMDSVQDKRAAILDAALHLISLHGFHGAPMSKVASEAGVSAGIIYHYFASKDELIDQLYITVKRQFMAAILADHDPDLPMREQIHRLLRNAIQYFMQHSEHTTFVEQFVRSPYNRPEIEQVVMGGFEMLNEMIEQARQQQIIKDLPDPVLYSLTLDVASSVAQKHSAGLLDLTDATIEQIVNACWDAIRQ